MAISFLTRSNPEMHVKVLTKVYFLKRKVLSGYLMSYKRCHIFRKNMLVKQAVNVDVLNFQQMHL